MDSDFTSEASPDESQSNATAKSGKKWRALGLIAVVLALFVLSQVFDVVGILTAAINWVKDLGVLGMAVFVLLYIIACVFMLPGVILTLAGGGVYGLWIGFPLVSVASTLGACAAFIVGRYFARDWVAARVADNHRFKAIDDAVGKQGWKIVLLTRLSPVFPFNLLNYGYGLTKVSFPHYALASWIGMMPGTVLYVYFGSLGESLTSLADEGRETTVAEWVMRVVGLLVTLGVTIFVTRIAKRALDNVVPEAEAAEKGD